MTDAGQARHLGQAAPHEVTDACILGAGPAGIFAVFQLGIIGLSAVVIDALDRPGGQCAALYPEKPIYDIPGWTQITGQALTDRLVRQIGPFGTPFHQSRTAIRAEPLPANDALPEGGWRIVSDDGGTVDCRVLVLATSGVLTPRLPPPTGLEPCYRGPDGRVPVDPATCAAALGGVFAIGDICAYPGKLKLIVAAFHEAALMAQAAFRICHPQKTQRLQYTTTSTALQATLGGMRQDPQDG